MGELNRYGVFNKDGISWEAKITNLPNFVLGIDAFDSIQEFINIMGKGERNYVFTDETLKRNQDNAPLSYESIPEPQIEREDEGEIEYDNHNRGETFGGYEGTYAQDVEGLSDNFINDVLDGDPDAYWNID